MMAVLSNIIRVSYQFHLRLNGYTLLVTFLCYSGCYFLAMFRSRRKFRKMNIQAVMNVKRQNEEIKESHENIRRIIFPLSVLLIISFWVIFPNLPNIEAAILFLILLVADIYLFYMGLSAWIICYIQKKKDGIYKGQNLFLLRQFSSKIRTMQFTMGTLTALFTIALMGCSVAMMFSDFENKLLDTKWPFDVLIYSADPKALKNIWEENGAYCRYDTYMGLTDYNYLRRMIGYQEISMKEDEYAIQIKARLQSEVKDMPKDLRIQNASGNKDLSCAGIYSDAFSQDGHNGGDYLLIVPDAVAQTMIPYYSEMAVDLAGKWE